MTDAYAPLVSSEPIEGQPLPPTIYQPTPERDRIDQEAGYYEASRGLAFRQVFEDAQITDRLLGFIGADNDRAFQAQRNRVFGRTYGTDAPLSSEEANSRYGVAGRLTFDKPISEPMAAWRQSLAQREAFRDQVVANADIGPLETIGASIAGSILDPIGLPLWAVPELATGRALRSGALASRLGRLGAVERGVLTGATEGLAGSLVYEGANLWLHHEAADDYDFGDASANVIFGGLLGGAAGGLGGWFEGRKSARAPRVVEALSEDGRTGAFAQAFGDMIEDRPVNLGPSLARTAEAGRLAPPADDVVRLWRADGDAPGRFSSDMTTTLNRAGETDSPVWYVDLPADDALAQPDQPNFTFTRDLPEDVAGRAVQADAGMNAIRWGRMDDAARLAWTADQQIDQARSRLAARENTTFTPYRGGEVDRWGATREDVALMDAEDRAIIAEIEAAQAAGRLDQVASVRIVAGMGDRAPSTTRGLLDATAAWVAREGDDAAPAASAAAAQSASRPSRAPAAESAKATAARRSKPKVAKGEAPPMPKGEPFADPEVAALAADTEAMLAREGLTAPQGAEPQTVADAVLAGAQCLMRSAA